jgi:hypothetical protein
MSPSARKIFTAVYYHVHKRPLLNSTLSHTNSVQILRSNFSKIHFNIIFSSVPTYHKRLFLSGSPSKIVSEFLAHLMRATCAVHLTLLHLVTIWSGAQFMKLAISLRNFLRNPVTLSLQLFQTLQKRAYQGSYKKILLCLQRRVRWCRGFKSRMWHWCIPTFLSGAMMREALRWVNLACMKFTAYWKVYLRTNSVVHISIWWGPLWTRATHWGR